MDSFGFTKKKLLSFCSETQNKHIISWLSRFYQKLTTNRVNSSVSGLFFNQYNQILGWMGLPLFEKPVTDRAWIETISDRIQYHRTLTKQAVRDYDLLERVSYAALPVSRHLPDFNCHVALDGLRSLFNVGSVFRTCEAAGFKSVILGNTPGKEDPRVQKTAMGAHRWVEQEKTDDLAQTLMKKKESRYRVVGIETVKHALAYDEVSWNPNTIVVFGNEEYGISSHVMAACDAFVHIPMFGQKNSINVANAVSVICFQIARTLSVTVLKSIRD